MVLGFLGSVLALAGIGWLSYRTTVSLIATEHQVSHTHEVIATLEGGLALLTDAETAQRGYLLTGDEQFLRDSRQAQSQIGGWLESLRKLTADNPEQLQQLDKLESLISQRLAVLNERIRLRQEQGLPAAIQAMARRDGKILMDQVWQQTAKIHETESRLLRQREQAAEASAHDGLFIILTGSALAFAVGLLAVLAIRRDLGKRLRAESALEGNRVLLQSILDNIPAVVYIKDLEGRYLFVNRQFEQLAGRSREEIRGKTVFDFSPKELAEAAHQHHQKVLATQRPVELEETVLYPDGPRPHRAVKFPLRDASGKIYATAGVSTDITERKRAEEERDRFFDVSRDLMCIAGFDGYFKALNPAWEEALGFSRQELQAKPFIEFVHPEDRATTLAQSDKLTAGEEIIRFENRYVCRDGSYRWLAWNARPAMPQRVIYATARDVTEEKKTEAQIIRLNLDLQGHAQQLEAANRELESFSYSVSHDLRAPLRHIDGFVKLLEKHSGERLDERGRRYLEIVADSTRQMGTLIDDLLVFSRMSRTELRRSKVALDSLVQEAVDAMQMEVDGRHVIWKIGHLPEVEGDPAMLRQVWVNLIGNAVKYSRSRDPAEIEIGGNAENGEIVLFVRDNGVGFDMTYVDKLFGVFQRLHHSDEFEGTGIGLANVRRIVSRHGGRTWAEGKVDGGATFFFSLPKSPTETKGQHGIP